MDQWNSSAEPAVSANFESRLIEALQPIRGMALAQGIHHLFLSGMHRLLESSPASAEDVAKALGMKADRVAGFFRYLAVEDIVTFEDGMAALTAKGLGLKEYRPWYELMVGGYAQTFGQITETLSKDSFATRDGLMVGLGSCGMSQFDALPMVRQLVADMPVQPTQLVDIGCGSGDFLIDLAKDYPSIHAVGVDPYAPLERADQSLDFHQASAVDYVRSLGSEAPGAGAQRLFVAGFLLQEILEQQGRDTVVEMVRSIVSSGAHLAVVEVDHRPTDPSVMQHGLGQAYYNPYYFLHILTEQRLETRAFWLDLFEEAGAEVVSCRTVNPRVDSTGLEFGCLLKAK
ncbi:2-ketoarginine methyltransferase [Kitasatospora kazusensis]|uniref:tRNA (guanine(46)-N(7))-methyltransferase n=1 Tax=Kitasatospora kazusensis TaxID=407974 RepID=A0ABN2ZAJ0_9ACTN